MMQLLQNILTFTHDDAGVVTLLVLLLSLLAGLGVYWLIKLIVAISSALQRD